MTIEKKEIIINIFKALKNSEDVHSSDVCNAGEYHLIHELIGENFIEAYDEKNGYINCDKIIFNITSKGFELLSN